MSGHRTLDPSGECRCGRGPTGLGGSVEPAPGNSLTPGAQPPGTALGPACSLKSLDCV